MLLILVLRTRRYYIIRVVLSEQSSAHLAKRHITSIILRQAGRQAGSGKTRMAGTILAPRSPPPNKCAIYHLCVLPSASRMFHGIFPLFSIRRTPPPFHLPLFALTIFSPALSFPHWENKGRDMQGARTKVTYHKLRTETGIRLVGLLACWLAGLLACWSAGLLVCSVLLWLRRAGTQRSFISRLADQYGPEHTFSFY